jgi:hypothetical protein
LRKTFLPKFALGCIQLACAWNVASAGRYGASVSIDRLYPSTWYWCAAPKELSQYWGTKTGQDRFRFHQSFGLYWRDYGGPLGSFVSTRLSVDAATRLTDRGWLKLGVTPVLSYSHSVAFPSLDLDVNPNVLLVINAYNPDFLVTSGPDDYSGPGLVVDGRAGFSPQWPDDLGTWLLVRGPWTWRTQDRAFEAGPRYELSRQVFDPNMLQSTQALGLEMLGVLGTRTEEAQLHPGTYLERRFSGQVGLDVSWYDKVYLDVDGDWTRTRGFIAQAEVEGWLRIWRGLLVELTLSVDSKLDRYGRWNELSSLLALAYVGRVSSSGYLIPRFSLDFGNALVTRRPIPFLSASLAWHG